MGPNDNAGRVSRHSYSVVLTLFALCLISATARFYVRVRVQKQVSIDDGFLLFGILCLAAAVGVMFTFIDSLYMLQAMQEGIPDLERPPDWLQRTFDCQKFLVLSLCLTWCTITAVKFSFLFLFRRLIDHIPRLIIYWWIVMVFNVAVAGLRNRREFSCMPMVL
ncbi:hypothetical protein GJ744_010092 [Endocarpon pusillum]|uniref:Rhodopsin domain-containing protein n=1 Tax=Endocarpon pusillum TaxID=364733 RepID=A0A8H7E5R2_9EURO|nr:hypothetical protein GJ744_010092 [Endocarpon pusillum]